MSPAEYLSSLTYKHPWAATAQAVALDMWCHHTDSEGSHRSGRKELHKQTQMLPHKEQAHRNSGGSRTIIQSFVDWKLYLKESTDSVSGVHTAKLQLQT